MTKRAAKRASGAKPKNREKIGKTPLDPTRPIGKGNPPIETQFKPGMVSNPKGRPRKLVELQELIYETMAEELRNPDGGLLGTRAQAMVRIGLSKNPVPFLEYAFGKVPQQIDINDITSKPDSELVAELRDILDAAAARASEDTRGGTPAARTGGD